MKEFIKKRSNILLTSIILLIALAITVITGIQYRSFSMYETYFDTSRVTQTQYLKQYSPNLKGTVGGETAIYIIAGKNVQFDQEGNIINPDQYPSLLVLGGTHPNEPSGQLTAALFLENAVVGDDTILFVITETNKSAYTHSHPQEASPFYYYLTTRNGAIRQFKFGSRATNTNEQWPNPDIYTHSSGQKLSTNETRNLNRAYPGSINGSYTEKVAYGITQLIKQNDIKVTIDLHEASPEYITINAIIAHQTCLTLASSVELALDLADVKIKAEVSPKTLHGLTHRELGDFTDTFPFLLETSNASQGKIRGAFTSDLITYYKVDKFYEKAQELTDNGAEVLYAACASIDERVARHVFTIEEIINAYNKELGKGDFAFEALYDEKPDTAKDRIQKLLAVGELEITLDLESMISAEDKLEYSGQSNYKLIFGSFNFDDEFVPGLGLGYFLHDPE